MFNIAVAGTSAVLKPSTTRSATADSTGFLERATLGAPYRIDNHWGDDGWCADRGSGDEFSFIDWPTQYISMRILHGGQCGC